MVHCSRTVEPGFACRALPTPPPRPCTTVCFAAKTRAKVKYCNTALCKLVKCTARGNQAGFRCVDK